MNSNTINRNNTTEDSMSKLYKLSTSQRKALELIRDAGTDGSLQIRENYRPELSSSKLSIHGKTINALIKLGLITYTRWSPNDFTSTVEFTDEVGRYIPL